MDVIEAIEGRYSARAYLDKPVSNETLSQILHTAAFAPSGVNTQPWHVVVVGTQARQKIAHEIIAARENGVPENPDYQYYPIEWRTPYKERRKACGAALYGALNIEYGDKEKRKNAWYLNYHFFHAPAALLFFIERDLQAGSWLDMGMFIQNVMLAARGHGLETCPQASLAEYPTLVRKIVGEPESMALICGMAIGYANTEAPVNQYRTERLSVNEFTRWV